ncbi:RHS repeat-associated core domain-containing protein [Gibbsiella quercinecans]|uniref:RHS repeat-associated core domain-containing protein n=1 Tax=Gibbsiella quercinecans TaxID=929813 RepID=UPI0024316A3C|nr:RHS repeat-associated core domain-containing protein [Gibbsiella quercinecans]
MADDLLAACKDDPLVHSSLLADFASGLVEGAIYCGIWVGSAALFGTGVGAVVGVGLLVGAMASGLPEKIGNAAGNAVDSALDALGLRGPPDAKITSGADNVKIVGKPAARAAGTVDHAYLNSPAADEEGPGALDTAIALAAGIAATVMHPGAVLEKLGKVDGDAVKNWLGDVWDDLTQPTVESASPHATPADKDTVDCSKGHLAENVNFLAEGSKKVLINGHPAARNGDRSTCEAKITVAGNPRVRIGGDSIVVRDIRSGKNALAYFIGALVGSLGRDGLKLAQSLFSRVVRRQAMKEIACTLAAAAAAELAANAIGASAARALTVATMTALPVHIPTGAKILAGEEDLDFTLADRLPLNWQRLYHSRNRSTGMLGTGWMLPFETRLIRFQADDGSLQFVWRDITGREIGLGAVEPGDIIHFYEDGFTLYCTRQGVMLLQNTDGEHQLYEPDPAREGEWRIARIYDRHENCHYFTWNSAGQLINIASDNQALEVELSYEAHHGRLAAVHQCAGNERHALVSYRYNEQGQLIAVQDADGITTRRFGWDSDCGLMAWHSYATGLTVRYHWQPAAQGPHWRVNAYEVLDEQQQSLEHWVLDADEQARSAVVTCLSGGSTEHHWDALNRITDYTDSYGARWQFQWSAQRESLSTVVNSEGQRWELAHDERGNLTLLRDPLGRATQTTWHKSWALPLKTVLPDGACWQYRYNVLGDPVEQTDPLGHVTRFSWNDQGDLVTRTDALENTARFWWNERGQLVREEDCSGHSATRQYDDSGRLLSSTDAAGNSTRFHWSAAGRLQRLIRPDGRETRYQYDRAGLPCRESVDGVSERQVARNVRGQIVSETDPAGLQTRYQYDRFGRMTALLNPNHDRWQFDYDNGDRLLAQTDYAGRRTQYGYDRLGQLTQITEYPLAAEGELTAPLHTRLAYDALGRRVAKDTADSHTEYGYEDRSVVLRRTALARWQQAQATGEPVEWEETLRFSLDAAGNLCSEDNHSGHWQHEYDPLGNLLTTRMPDGSALNHLRYGTGHLLQMNLQHGGRTFDIAGWQRDALHREISRTQGALHQETRYDALGRITLRRATGEREHAFLFERRYLWDRQDQLVQQMFTEDGIGQPGPQCLQSRFGYDARGQLTHSIQPHQEERFHYDAAGNRTDSSSATVWHNLLQRLGGTRWGYDRFGRLNWRHNGPQGEEQRFSYDAEHRLTSVSFTGNPHYQRAEYRYDALGRRSQKILYPHHGEPETITFHWNGLRMVGEQSSLRPEQATRYLYQENSWEPLARVDSIGESSEVYWYHTELNGLPTRMTDEHGNLVWQGQFSAWGETRSESTPQPLATPQNLRYQGQYLDRETGLHYNLFRYYDPQCGRFTQPDPIGLLGGLNNYAYAPNPLTWIDPLGLARCNAPNGYKTGDVDPHGNLSPSANRASGHLNTKSDGFVQSHHPIQDAWAKRRVGGYQRNSAPATLLRSSSGSPHAGISAAQRTRRAMPGGWDTSLKQEFNISYREMLDAGVPSGQAKKSLNDAYKYFDGLRENNIGNPFFDI